MTQPSLNESSAVALAAAMRAGEVTAEAVASACLARIAKREPTVHAWAYLDPDAAIAQARAADARQRLGDPLGPLHGVPVGVKDIFDTGDMPTEYGSDLYRGRQPSVDARVVTLLRNAGAVILGKTVTAELALSAPGETTNPRDPARTPGGSSSGSAAAVADFMVPLAVGSQTGGSVIRPASFCGVYGYKPTFGSISRTGMHLLSAPLDHVGMFARSLEEIAVTADVLMAADASDPHLRERPGAALTAALAGPLRPPRLAFVRGPVWGAIEAETAQRLEALRRRPDLSIPEIDLPPELDAAAATQRLVTAASLAANLGPAYRDRPDRLRPQTRARIEAGLSVAAADYIRALAATDDQRRALDRRFDEFDALVTAAAPGEAPVGLDTTGDPIFCVIWTLLGLPALSLPLLSGPAGLPLGVQLIGRRGEDARLFEAARWLVEAGGAGRRG